MKHPRRVLAVSIGFVSLLLVDEARAFSAAPLRRASNTERYPAKAVALFQTSSSNDENTSDGDSNTLFMASLQKRMNQVSENDSILPLVVLDAMLPRQVLKIAVQNDLLKALVRTRIEAETPFFGMLGLARLETGEKVHLRTGVKVEILGKPRIVTDSEDGGDEQQELHLELKAVERFRIQPETVENAKHGGWTQARVTFLDSSDQERAERENGDPMSVTRSMQMAREFTDPNVSMDESKSLVDMWIELARQRERKPGQIDQLLADLGPIPSWEEPSECAFWVGALINPIPAIGVAREIRPQLLLAASAEERTQIALDGIWNSIQYMQGPRIEKIKE